MKDINPFVPTYTLPTDQSNENVNNKQWVNFHSLNKYFTVQSCEQVIYSLIKLFSIESVSHP